MSLSDRLSLHLPSGPSDKFGDYFPVNYAADLLKIDEEVQIRLPAAIGKMPVYDEDGFLISSGIAPGDLEIGLLDSILTTQGMLLYRSSSALAALAADTAGKSLLTQGAGANPVFGYPSHNTLLNLTVGDSHTQYHNDARGDARYSLLAHAHDPLKLDDLATPDDNTDLNVSTARHGLMPKLPNNAQVFRGDGTWQTQKFEIDFPFGDGTSLILASQQEWGIPVACKITKVEIWEVGLISGSVTCTLYKHTIGQAKGTAVGSYAISSSTYYQSSALNISVAEDDILRIETSGIASVKQIVCRLKLEAT